MTFNKQAKFYLILVVFSLIMYESNSVPLAAGLRALKSGNLKNFKVKRSNYNLLGDTDKCILSCVKCSGDDIYQKHVNKKILNFMFIYTYNKLNWTNTLRK